MKRFRIIFICCCIIVLATQTVCCGGKTEYLRIHVRANSDCTADQSVKYRIKDEIVSYLTPIIENCKSKDEAIDKVKSNESAIKRLIDRFLQDEGFEYSCTIEVRREEFPTRVYDGVTLPSGVYEAVIVELGSGKGANWWCVVYPPLCFSGGKVTYKSKLAELFNG